MSKEDIDTLYQRYSEDRSPQNLAPVVKALEPAINYALVSIGAADDKLVKHKARIMAGMAVEKYDPTQGASLKTWTGNQLMQLRRFNREVKQPVKLPERVQLDGMTLKKAEMRFLEEHDREPDVQELSDYAKMPVKRIEKIRSMQRIMPSETVFTSFGEAAMSIPDWTNESLEYVYDDSDKIDRAIIEMKTGYGGKYTPMQPKEIAAKLKITPSQLTRRSARIAYRVQQLESALEEVA